MLTEGLALGCEFDVLARIAAKTMIGFRSSQRAAIDKSFARIMSRCWIDADMTIASVVKGGGM
jgi:hypothetical protein